MIKIIIGILAVLLTAILLLQIDDDLHPDIPPILATYNAPEDNDAYFYLLGLDAPADTDPTTFGKQKLTDKNYDNDLPKLPIPSGSLFSHNDNATFLTSAFTSDTIAETLENNAVLLARYETFIAMDGYQTASTPSVDEPLPAYPHLAAGNKLFLLKAIHTAKSSDLATATTLLSNHITALRSQLVQTDNLVGKLIFTLFISKSIDALSIIAGQADSITTAQIQPLTIEEQSFQRAMYRELAIMSNIMTSLDKNPEFFTQFDSFDQDSVNDNSVPAPGWLVRMFFKPNMSINPRYYYYNDIVALSELSPNKFANIVQDKIKQHASAHHIFSIRNLAGSMLTNISAPSFERYVGQVFDLNIKIALFNQMHGQSEAIPVGQLTNPYYDKTGTAFYSADKNSICLTGPIDTGNDNDSRCLTLAY